MVLMKLGSILSHQAREIYWNSVWLQSSYSAFESLRARMVDMSDDPYAALVHYCDAARRVRVPGVRKKRLEEFGRFVGKHFSGRPPRSLAENIFVEWFLRSPDAEPHRALRRKLGPEGQLNLGKRLIVLKVPEGEERGVLLTRYASELFLVSFHLEAIARLFTVVVEPSWALFPLPFWGLYSVLDGRNVAQVNSEQSVEDLRSTGLPLLGIAMGSQDWVDPDVFRPLPDVRKEFDVVMIATYQRLKRHDVLFRAMRRLRPRRLRVALIGRTLEQSRTEFEAMMHEYGVHEDCVIFQQLSPAQVNEVLNRSKVNVLLSRAEGGNKGLLEGFAANVPCVVYKRMMGHRQSDINPMTGRLSDDEELAEVLLDVIEHYQDFSPREWFLQNTGYRNSTRRLNALLQEEALRRGEPWTTDIVPKVNRPYLEYVNPADCAKVQRGWDELQRALREV